MEKDPAYELSTQVQAQVPSLDYCYYGGRSSSTLRDYWRILLKRKWWCLGFLALTVGIAWLINTYSTPIYQATATLRVSSEPGAFVGGRDAVNPWLRDDDRSQETIFNIMRSRSLAKRVIKILNLKDYPGFMPKEPEGAEKISPEEAESNSVGIFLSNLKTDPIRKSDLVRISYSSSDKDLAQKIVNVFTEEYMQFEIDCKNQSFTQIRQWLGKQIAQLGDRVEGSQRKLYQYGGAGEILSQEDKDNVVFQKYMELNGLLTKASADRITKESQYHQISKMGAAASPITNNPLVLELRKQISTESAKVAGLRKIYLANHPKLMAEEANLQGLQSRLTSEIKNIRATVEADYGVARRAENLITEALEAEKQKIADLQKKLVQYKILKRDVDANEELYKGLLSRMKEAAISSTMVSSVLSVIDPAETPLFPSSPRKFRNMALAIVMGLMGGVFLAFIIEQFDDTIKTVEEAETVCQLPILGIVPLLRRNKGLALLGQGTGAANPEPGLIPYNNLRSIVADAIFGVRTSVLLSGPAGPPATIMVTSPNPSEGKSTMAANLAISLAIDGRKVLLIDADMRQPSIHKFFNLPPMPGLSDAITGSAAYKDVILPTEIPNLSIITAGTTPPNPASLLGSKVFKDTLESLREEFQHIIIDTPPTLGMPDSRILSPSIDSAILVLKYHSTRRETARAARLMLSQVHTKLIGVVLNQVSSQGNGYSGYYKYYDQNDLDHSAKGYLMAWKAKMKGLKNSWLRKP
jgi:capsular exopolysaccharide synthesis family protein